MPIPIIESYEEDFTEENLRSIAKSRRISLSVFLIGIVITVFIFVLSSLWGFYQYYHFYYFVYDNWLAQISLCYILSWSLFFLFVFSIANNSYLHIFTYKDKILLKKYEDKKTSAKREEIKEDKSKKKVKYDNKIERLIYFNYFGQGLLAFLILFELNYYARNVELFYGVIACDPDLGLCVVPETVYLPFLFVRIIFLISLLGFYSFLILILKQELKSVNLVLQKEPEKRIRKVKEEKRYIPIEQRKQQKIMELREKHLQKEIERKAELQEKFEKRYQEDALGKKQLKRDLIRKRKQKRKEQKEKEKEEIKKIKKVARKDEFDFT